MLFFISILCGVSIYSPFLPPHSGSICPSYLASQALALISLASPPSCFSINCPMPFKMSVYLVDWGRFCWIIPVARAITLALSIAGCLRWLGIIHDWRPPLFIFSIIMTQIVRLLGSVHVGVNLCSVDVYWLCCHQRQKEESFAGGLRRCFHVALS